MVPLTEPSADQEASNTIRSLSCPSSSADICAKNSGTLPAAAAPSSASSGNAKIASIVSSRFCGASSLSSGTWKSSTRIWRWSATTLNRRRRAWHAAVLPDAFAPSSAVSCWSSRIVVPSGPKHWKLETVSLSRNMQPSEFVRPADIGTGPGHTGTIRLSWPPVRATTPCDQPRECLPGDQSVRPWSCEPARNHRSRAPSGTVRRAHSGRKDARSSATTSREVLERRDYRNSACPVTKSLIVRGHRTSQEPVVKSLIRLALPGLADLADPGHRLRGPGRQRRRPVLDADEQPHHGSAGGAQRLGQLPALLEPRPSALRVEPVGPPRRRHRWREHDGEREGAAGLRRRDPAVREPAKRPAPVPVSY